MLQLNTITSNSNFAVTCEFHQTIKKQIIY